MPIACFSIFCWKAYTRRMCIKYSSYQDLKIAKLGNIMRLDVTGCDLLSPEDYAALLAPSY